MYTSVCLSNGDRDQGGFEDKRLAMSYIAGWVCDGCNNDLKMGYFFIDPGCEHKEMVNDILDTDCGAEWLIITDEEYDEASTVTDYFIAAGYDPDDRTEQDLSDEQRRKLEEKRKEYEGEIEEDFTD